MYSVLLISENASGREVLKSARRLLGPLKQVHTLALSSRQSCETMVKLLKKMVQRLQNIGEILILTDLYGSTQWNVCHQFEKKGSIQIITGYNFPMFVKALTLQQKMSLEDVVPFLEEYGRKQIRHCCDLE